MLCFKKCYGSALVSMRDQDPDPAFLVKPDLDPGLVTKNKIKNLQLKIILLFYIKNCNLLISWLTLWPETPTPAVPFNKHYF
jgi:hypothetical protein